MACPEEIALPTSSVYAYELFIHRVLANNFQGKMSSTYHCSEEGGGRGVRCSVRQKLANANTNAHRI